MSEYEPDMIGEGPQTEPLAEETSPEGSVAEQAACAPVGPRWKRVVKRIFIGIGVTLALLILLGVALYYFGGPSGSAVPGVEAQFDQMVADGTAQPVRNRLVIPIPGCQCHSTDPVLTAVHSKRHMNECMKCHNTNPPHLEPGVQ